ncbi:MAG: 3-dehydroquinate synthase [Taibaiella sp.]|nr:3-dehydroquinate synthase [Taibaiella sp.]
MQPMPYTIKFPAGAVQYLYGPLSAIDGLSGDREIIVITDTNIAALYPELEKRYRVIAIPPGEVHKNQHTADDIIESLLEMEAHRKTTLVGIGGGLVTDITGYVASIYMRGIPYGFVPTTLLGMVDAAIGGKNGINHRLQKNLIGTINQPGFILYDTTFLKTLPDEEWSNGFAEVIKYGCIFDKSLFDTLSEHNIDYYKQGNTIDGIIQMCVSWKNQTVVADEKEKGRRKLLNFGHTAGHALEILYGLPHGQAVGIGMVIACIVSEKLNGLDKNMLLALKAQLKKYNLRTYLNINTTEVMEVLRMDKKRNGDQIDYITLNQIGESIITTMAFDIIEEALTTFSNAGDN